MSERDWVSGRIHMLKLGADDYIVRPIGTEELLARVHAVLGGQGESPYSAGTEKPRLLAESRRRRRIRNGVGSHGVKGKSHRE